MLGYGDIFLSLTGWLQPTIFLGLSEFSFYCDSFSLFCSCSDELSRDWIPLAFDNYLLGVE